MPITKYKRNLVKVCKRQYRNPIYLAKEWRKALDDGEFASCADIARHHKISRARVTQILNLLTLAPEVIDIIASLGDTVNGKLLTERKLRSMLALSAEQQKVQIGVMLFGENHT